MLQLLSRSFIALLNPLISDRDDEQETPRRRGRLRVKSLRTLAYEVESCLGSASPQDCEVSRTSWKGGRGGRLW